MSFRRYPEYEDSGVVWLGDVPAGWTVCSLNYRYEVALGKMLDEKRIIGKHLAPYLRNVDVQWGSINIEALPLMDFLGDDLQRYSLRCGDLLVCEGGEIGRAAIWGGELEECYYQKALHRLRPRAQDRDSASFLFYWFCFATAVGILAGSEGKSTIAHLPAETLRRYQVPFPSKTEQSVIAAFLDRETGKIDALVAEQEKLISLLKEKRQAIISHAVTKGLNSDVAMKPSGIEWLGGVPAHWEIVPIRRIAETVDTGGTPTTVVPSEARDSGVPWYTPGDFNGALMLGRSTKTVSRDTVESGEAKLFPPGSVLVVSIGATLGKVAFAQQESSANQQINAIVPNEQVDGYFLTYSLTAKTEVMRFLSNASTIGIMNQEKTKDIAIALPPRNEQAMISSFLDGQITALEALVAQVERAIALLKERRSALISAAVTGRIDVRGLS